MASFNLRRFANPAVLKTIHEQHLLALLSPHAAYFARRGVSLMPSGQMLRVAEPMAAYGGVTPVPEVANGVDYEALAGVFVDPDEAMPPELVDALYLIDEMATPEGMDELLGLGDLVTLDDSQEQTPADVATQVFLRAPRLLERKHGEQFVGERTSFVYFLSEKEPTGKFVKPDEKKLETLQRNLGEWFLKKKKGDQVRVFVYPKEDEVWFLVRHGEGFRREGAQKDGESTSVFFRPEKHDVLVYTPAIGELRINAGSDGERDVYRTMFGLYLFGGTNHFPSGNKKYTLEPLRKDGASSIACTDVEGIDSISLSEIAYYWGGAQGEVEIRRATGDLFTALAEREGKIQKAKIVSAKFRVKFSDSKTPRSVSVRPPNVAKFTRDDDGRRIDEWLLKRDFSALTRQHEEA